MLDLVFDETSIIAQLFQTRKLLSDFVNRTGIYKTLLLFNMQ